VTEKRRLLIVASKLGYQTRIFAEAAVRLGLEPVMATDRCSGMDDPWGDHAIALKFQHPEKSAAKLVRESKDIAGIVAVGDRPTPVAARAARKLGLPFHPPEAVDAARNKYLAREKWRDAGLPVPRYFKACVEDGWQNALRRASLPCVLKPLGLSGSRGVIRANDAAEFGAAFERICEILDRPDIRVLKDENDRFIQVEQYIAGSEFALEGLMTGGVLRTLALFDKPDPLEGPFFEETIYVTPSRSPQPEQAVMQEAAQRACRALGLSDGPVHAELRFNAEGPWMLEVAARPIGGLCARALRFNAGMPLEEVIVRHALGETVGGLTLDGPASGVMMIPIPKNGIYRGVRGVAAARAVPGIDAVEITAVEGQALWTLPEGSSYLGFLFARADCAEQVERALRQAHAKLEFDIPAFLRVL
jgi:biotin carboxylase